MTGFMRQKLEGEYGAKTMQGLAIKITCSFNALPLWLLKERKGCTGRLQKCRVQAQCSAFGLSARLQHGIHLHNI